MINPPTLLSMDAFDAIAAPTTLKTRRTTCDICRERKVRCDKQHPVCGRCRRLNRYNLTKDPIDVSHVLRQLHERLAQAEAALASRATVPTPQTTATNTVGVPVTSDVPFSLQSPSKFPELPWDPSTHASSVQTPATAPTGPDTWPPLVDPAVDFDDTILTDALQAPPIHMPTPDWLATPRFEPASNPDLVNASIVSILHQCYFETNGPDTSVIDRDRFNSLLTQTPPKHQVSALSYAVAMAGATLSEDFPHLESLCYHAARHHIERAERYEDGADFVNLELLQALLLVLRYEVTDADSAQAWMTHSRTMRLTKLLCLDSVDVEPTRAEMRRPLPAGSADELEERRRTFWVAFSMDFFVSCLTGTLPEFRDTHVLTSLPRDERDTEDSMTRTILLNDALKNLGAYNSYSPLTRLLLATALGNKALRHLEFAAHGTTPYDFWSNHFEIDNSVRDCLSTSPFSPQHGAGTDDPMLVTTHLALLGISMLLQTAALERALRSARSNAMAAESWLKREAAAKEVSDVLKQTGTFDKGAQFKICHHIRMYLAWPVLAAAQVLMQCFAEPPPGLDPPLSVADGTAMVSIRALYSSVRSLKVASRQHEEVLRQLGGLLMNNGSLVHSPAGSIQSGRYTSSNSTLNSYFFL